MTIGQSMAQELKQELETTRRVFEAIPEDKLDYKPHEKSMSLRMLASHIAESMGWTAPTVHEPSWTMDMETYRPWVGDNLAAILAELDEKGAEAVKALSNAPDASMMDMWSMIDAKSGTAMFTMPRVAVVRGFMISHMIHHRAQITVYLRMLDAPVPQVYGPTADNPEMGAPD